MCPYFQKPLRLQYKTHLVIRVSYESGPWAVDLLAELLNDDRLWGKLQLEIKETNKTLKNKKNVEQDNQIMFEYKQTLSGKALKFHWETGVIFITCSMPHWSPSYFALTYNKHYTVFPHSSLIFLALTYMKCKWLICHAWLKQ